MNELSLFTGAGGGLLGTKLLGWKHIGYVEINKYCQQVIRQRIDDGILDEAPIFGDIRTFISDGYADAYSGLVDVVTAGFPCEPFSLAGKRRGSADERNMWPATIECIRLVRPARVLLENVPGIRHSGYFGTILGQVAAAGYDCKWETVSALECGAPHFRERVWIKAKRRETVANTDEIDSNTGREQGGREKRPNIDRGVAGEIMADANSKPIRKSFIQANKANAKHSAVTWWQTEPAVDRVAYGVAHGMDRLEAIGKGQVPAVVRTAWGVLSDA